MLETTTLNPALAKLQQALLVFGTGGPLGSLALKIVPAHAAAIANSLALYSAVRSVSGANVVVDATKDPRRLKALYLAHPGNFRVVFMLRDGRAVAASNMRRTGVSMMTAANQWLSDHRRNRWAMLGIPRSQVLFVHYESLCQNPAQTLSSIYRFLALPIPSIVPTEIPKEEAHDISGNPMRLRRDQRTIHLDNRWRTYLGRNELQEFERLAGRANRALGYSDGAGLK